MYSSQKFKLTDVAPLVGAWIEMTYESLFQSRISRSSRGSVD